MVKDYHHPLRKRQGEQGVGDRVDGEIALGLARRAPSAESATVGQQVERAGRPLPWLTLFSARRVTIWYSQVENDDLPRNRVQVLPRGDQRFLRDVLGVVVIAGEAQGHPVGHGRVPLDQEFVSVHVAFPGAGHQVGVPHGRLGRLAAAFTVMNPLLRPRYPSRTQVPRHGRWYAAGRPPRKVARISGGGV